MSPNLAFRRPERESESERSRVGNSWEQWEEAGFEKEFEYFFWFCTCYYLRRNANFTRAKGVSYVPISVEVASTWKCSHKCVLFVVCKWEVSLGGRPPREDLKLWTRNRGTGSRSRKPILGVGASGARLVISLKRFDPDKMSRLKTQEVT
jgi:hypothetical protein